MKVDTFLVERFMAKYQPGAELDIAETCVHPFTLGEFLSYIGEEDFLEKLKDLHLTYGYEKGLPELREAIAELFKYASPENILTARGGIDANFQVFYTLIEPGDHVVAIFPAYQQLYSAPRSLGAKVKLWKLTEEERWVPNLDKLNELVDKKTKLIVIINPHNPTGAVFDEKIQKGIAEIAEDVGAYVLSDEAYFGLWIDPDFSAPTMADIYEKAIVTRTFSKPLSLTGLRLGWIVVPDELIEEFLLRRDYTTITTSILVEKLAYLAIKNIDKIYERSLKIVRENFNILKKWIEKEPLIDWIPPKGGSVAYPKYLFDMPSKELSIKLVEEKGVFVVPAWCFEMEGYFRVGFGNPTWKLQEGLKRFSEFLEKFR